MNLKQHPCQVLVKFLTRVTMLDTQKVSSLESINYLQAKDLITQFLLVLKMTPAKEIQNQHKNMMKK